jgi:hypothetical protein
MACRFHHPLETLLKTSERAYLIDVAYKKKKQDRKEIEQSALENFKPNPQKRIRNLYGVSFQEYVDRLVEIENQTFGKLDSAFVPSRNGYDFVSESDLERRKKQHELMMKAFPRSKGNYKIVCEEINGSTTETKRRLFSKCGLRLVEHPGLEKEEWMKKLNKFVELAKSQPYVSSVYLAGSLAKGVTVSKDADVIMVRASCPNESCEIYRSLSSSEPVFGKRIMIISEGSIEFPLDLYCFNNDEFESLDKGNYRIAQGKKLLFHR